MKRMIAIVLLLGVTCSCSSMGSGSRSMGNGLPKRGGVTHVIVVWLKKPGDAEARKRVIAESKKLAEIPGVVGVSAGEVIPSPRQVVDSSFDVAIVMTFGTREDLEKYTSHPKHQALVQNVIRPLVDHYRVYDIQND